MSQRLTVADLSILGAVLAYMVPVVIAKFGALQAFDNAKPRDQDFYKDPFRARGLWAHQNGIEGFAFFAAAVIVAELKGAAQPVVDGLAVSYVLLRLAYTAAYLADRAVLRSLVWLAALGINAAILFSPAFAKG